MVEALGLTRDSTVLEIGTGLGYQTALLARLALGVERRVVGRPRSDGDGEPGSPAGEDVTVVVGDGGAGLPEHAPFDAIAVSAAAPVVPRPLVEQLADGGRLVQPIGPGGHDEVCLFSKHDRVLVPVRDVVPARFVSLTDRYGCP
jgi:protein-L-isoaspartate(D-aspartate) O-methyltransferase